MTIRIAQAWINAYLDRQAVTIALRDGYTLIGMQVAISPGGIKLSGELQDNPGSFIDAQASIRWEAETQRLYFDDLAVDTRTRNLMVKSAGWFAGKFMQDKIDKQVEQAVNDLLQRHLRKLVEEDLSIPLRGNGQVNGLIRSVRLNRIDMGDQAMDVAATIAGEWHIDLNAAVNGGNVSA